MHEFAVVLGGAGRIRIFDSPGVLLALIESIALLDGRMAHNPYTRDTTRPAPFSSIIVPYSLEAYLAMIADRPRIGVDRWTAAAISSK